MEPSPGGRTSEFCACYGSIVFSGRAMPLPAQFIRLVATGLSPVARATRAVRLMEQKWLLPRSKAVISVMGSHDHADAHHLVLTEAARTAVSTGLARAAVATNAWVVTAGSECGASGLVGRALAEHDGWGAAMLLAR